MSHSPLWVCLACNWWHTIFSLTQKLPYLKQHHYGIRSYHCNCGTHSIATVTCLHLAGIVSHWSPCVRNHLDMTLVYFYLQVMVAFLVDNHVLELSQNIEATNRSLAWHGLWVCLVLLYFSNIHGSGGRLYFHPTHGGTRLLLDVSKQEFTACINLQEWQETSRWSSDSQVEGLNAKTNFEASLMEDAGPRYN